MIAWTPGSNEDPYQITSRRPGEGTGDVIYTTKDGRVWVPTTDPTPRTGTEIGDADDHRINPRKD